MAGRLAGQTINDRLLAAKHSIAGQGLAKSVCKATTEELIPPKKKHLEYLVQCTNEPNVSIPQLANLLIERSQNTNWVVVYKALITVHHIMCHGNERFTQYLASSNSSFQLSNFLDKSGVQGMLSIKTGYDMSPFIRRYAHYINEKALAYRTVAFDFCKKRSNDDGQLRTMHTDKLLKTLPILQSQLDALLEFDCTANDLTNGVINKCFMYLFGDLIRLFAGYNSGIINLLEKYFDMNKKQCKEALDIYKKFLTRMDRVGEFLKVAENVGINKGEIPDLTKAPSSLLEALEQHLAYVEGKKTSAASTPSQNASNQKNLRSAVTALSSTSSSFGTVVANGRIDQHANGIDENLKLQILAEEEAVMNQFKTKLQYSPPTMSKANNPFFGNSTLPTTTTHLPSQTQSADFLIDGARSNAAAHMKPSDDLLQLNNPFADAFAQPTNSFSTPQLPVLQQPNNISAWMTNGNGYTTQPPTNGAFVSESNFQSVFGNTEVKSSGFDALGGVLQPMPLQGNNNNVSNKHNQTNNNNHQEQQQQTGSALLTGDLDSSLASLAKNLSINSRAVPVKEIQWNSPKNGSKVGSSWSPVPMSSTTGGAGYKPMNQSMSQSNVMQAPMYNTPIQPIMGMRPMVANNMVPPMGASQPPAAHLMGQQSLLFH